MNKAEKEFINLLINLAITIGYYGLAIIFYNIVFPHYFTNDMAMQGTVYMTSIAYLKTERKNLMDGKIKWR